MRRENENLLKFNDSFTYLMKKKTAFRIFGLNSQTENRKKKDKKKI